MSKYLKVLILLFAFMSTTVIMHADDDNTFRIPVTQECDPTDWTTDLTRHRMPPRPVMCTISPDGVSLAAIQSQRISLFEICNVSRECIAAFTDESEFVDYIYSYTSTDSVEIRLHVDDTVYSGYLNL